ncbi:profilin [Eurytemora carolleeae]|uniref:profilin n=2 Tax=Eurytemora carolleeae TaxID=1294199 RepID=UPI000C75F2BC|nr:profilin [Eurytemora carolleeae]|eukprot:XP_023336151.1 profilin-like [Eurytemora affinis]
MSWQSYVDDQLLATKVVTKAVIAGHDGSIWATSEGFKVTTEDIKKILANFENRDLLAQNGITVAETRYIYLSSTDRVLRARKGNSGVHVMKTEQAVIICQYEEPVVPEQCAAVTEKLGEYLITVGY